MGGVLLLYRLRADLRAQLLSDVLHSTNLQRDVTLAPDSSYVHPLEKVPGLWLPIRMQWLGGHLRVNLSGRVD